MCICALLAMPAARGLFGAAAIQSGPPFAHSAPRANEAATSFVHELGMSEVSRHALEKVPVGELVRALASASDHVPRPGELPQPLIPVVDGASLPRPPLDAIAGGSAAGVATIVGTNRDEMTFFALGDGSIETMDDEALQRRIERSAPDVPAGRVVAHYREVMARRGERLDARHLWFAAGSDVVFRWPSLRLAAALGAHDPRTFVYLFTWESPAFGGILGATHALEIPFVFGTHADPGISRFVGVGSEADALSAAMQASWVSLARGGDPSNPLVGRWPGWDPERRATMVFGPGVSVEHAPRNDELSVWEAAAPFQVDDGVRWSHARASLP
jgi:para-nitrobenzyl esterase